MTTPSDAREAVEYLKTKATGATLQDAKATLPSRLLDSRKLSGYEAWGLVSREGDRIRLTDRGRRLARAASEDAREVFAEIVLDIHAYRIAAEWIYHQGLDSVPVADLAAHWFDHVRTDLGTEAERTIRHQAACFFGLAEGAGFGTYLLGRRGKPTRLEVDREMLKQLISGVPPSHEATESGEPELPEAVGSIEPEAEPQFEETVATERAVAEHTAFKPRVFISHGPNLDVVDQVKTMLDLSDLEYEVVVEQESTAIPVPEKVFEAMRRCDAAVICVTADDETKNGGHEINPNVLIEIGAAFVLYEKRVALLWDRRIRVPSNLQGLYRCEFTGAEMTWSDGMKLMKTVSKFKKIG